MAGVAVLAAALTDHSARAYSLWIDGLDVIKQPGGAGGWGAPIDSIRVVEQGPGGISSLNVTVDDPSRSLTFSDGAFVRYHDHVRDRPEFLGFVQVASPRPMATGRAWDITCEGIESVLDWMIVPAATIVAGTDIQTAIQSLVGQASGSGVQLRAFASNINDGNEQFPIGELATIGVASLSDTVVISGDTLREAIRKVLAVAEPNGAQKGPTSGVSRCTVDFYFGLRVFRQVFGPNDYDLLTVTDSAGSPNFQASGLQHTIDYGAIVRGVYVQGGNANGTGLISDGTGKPGEIAYISDSNVTTEGLKLGTAWDYMGDKRTGVRGSFTLESVVPSASNYRAGGLTQITDVQVGLSANQFSIETIERSYFPGGQQDWAITYGMRRPSLVTQTRRLTRAIRA